MSRRRIPRSFSGSEAVVVAGLLVLCLMAGVLAVRFLGEGHFYQEQFTPAAMLACGEGFNDVPAADRPDELRLFLGRERRTLDCDTLRGLPHQAPNDFQEGTRWTLTLTAGLWAVGGVSWDGLLPLQLLLLILSALAAYGLARMVARPWVAAFLALVAITLPLHLRFLTEIRDYSKAPFMLLGVLGIVRGALAPTLRARLIAAALGGVATGLGLGFRSDLLILVPIAVVALQLQPWQGRGRLWTGPAAAAVFVAGFLAAAAPILPSYGDGSNNGGIVAVEGLMPEFTDRLGLDGDLYTAGYLYNDLYTQGLAAAHGRIALEEPGPYVWGTPELDATANNLFQKLTLFLPADSVLRAGSALVQSVSFTATPLNERGVAPLTLGLIPVVLVVVGLVMLGARRPRALAVALVIWCGLAAITALQFHVRHLTHLTVVPAIATAGLLELALRRRAQRPGAMPPRARLVRSASIQAGLVAAAVGVWLVLAAFQSPRIDGYLADLQRAPATPLPSEAHVGTDGIRVPIERSEIAGWDGVPDSRSAYLRVAVDGCVAPHGRLTLRYRAVGEYYDFTATVPVVRARADSPPSLWFVVAHAEPRSRPSAVELADAHGCRLRVSRVWPDVPVLLNVMLDDGTRDESRHLEF